jgi:hypothetical protein
MLKQYLKTFKITKNYITVGTFSGTGEIIFIEIKILTNHMLQSQYFLFLKYVVNTVHITQLFLRHVT